MKRLAYLYSILAFGFLLGVYKGRIALWKGDDPQPVKVFPYYAAMLPKKDQQALEQGIFISDESYLHDLLEDYLS